MTSLLAVALDATPWALQPPEVVRAINRSYVGGVTVIHGVEIPHGEIPPYM